MGPLKYAEGDSMRPIKNGTFKICRGRRLHEADQEFDQRGRGPENTKRKEIPKADQGEGLLERQMHLRIKQINLITNPFQFIRNVLMLLHKLLPDPVKMLLIRNHLKFNNSLQQIKSCSSDFDF